MPNPCCCVQRGTFALAQLLAWQGGEDAFPLLPVATDGSKRKGKGKGKKGKGKGKGAKSGKGKGKGKGKARDAPKKRLGATLLERMQHPPPSPLQNVASLPRFPRTALPSHCPYNVGLEELDLAWNHIQGAGAKRLSQGLRHNNKLSVLDLSYVCGLPGWSCWTGQFCCAACMLNLARAVTPATMRLEAAGDRTR